MLTGEQQGIGPVDIENIPDELKATPQWVIWRAVPKPNQPGKFDKVPYDPHSGTKASVSDADTWVPFSLVTAEERIGFVFTADDPFVGIDLDGARNPQTGEIAAWALDVIRRFPGWYWEASPSGTGVHGIGKGKLPPGGRKRDKIEVYEAGRFFTVTGYSVAGTTQLEDHTAELAAWHESVFGKATPTRQRTAKEAITEHDRERIPAALGVIPAVDYDVWLRIGMALHAVGDDQYERWRAWSATCPEKFDEQACRQKWASFSDRSQGVTIATIFQYAKAHGYVPTRNGHGREEPPAPQWDEHESTKQYEDTHQEWINGQGKDLSSFPNTELGNSERLMYRHGENLRYCHPWGKWLVWDGKRWTVDNIQRVKVLAKDTIRALYRDAAALAEQAAHTQDEDKRKKLAGVAQHQLQWARRSETAGQFNAMCELAQSACPALPDALDTHLWLLNCDNGTIDLRTGTLHPHTRTHLLTKWLPVSYYPEAVCPTWESFLETVLAGRQDVIDFLWRAIGYSLTGDTSEQCLFLMYGTGANGKSTFLDTMRQLLGDYAEQTDFSTFLHRDRETIRNDLAKLRGARLVTASEADEGKRLAEGLVKQITGGDRITARFLFHEYFDFTPHLKLWLAANHKPEIRGTDYAIWRRIHLLPFTVTIPKEDQDKSLPARLQAELPGIFAWAVRGCLAWQKDGRLIPPDAVRLATEEYRAEMDVIGSFILESCDVYPEAQSTSAELYTAYSRWCDQSGEKPMTQTAFAGRLKERGLESGRSSLTGRKLWKGIRVRMATEES